MGYTASIGQTVDGEKKRPTFAALRTARVLYTGTTATFAKKALEYNGRKQGVWLTFTRGGNLSIRATYSSGLLNRQYFSYYQNGNIKWQGVYNRNRKDGKWTNYSPSGEKRLVQYWDNNRLINGIDCRDDPDACE